MALVEGRGARLLNQTLGRLDSKKRTTRQKTTAQDRV